MAHEAKLILDHINTKLRTVGHNNITVVQNNRFPIKQPLQGKALGQKESVNENEVWVSLFVACPNHACESTSCWGPGMIGGVQKGL